MPELTLPTTYELFERPRPPRLPHIHITKAESERSEIGKIAMEVADREIARLLVNIALFDPPITDAEIQYHAAERQIPFFNAQLELRRLRNGDSLEA